MKPLFVGLLTGLAVGSMAIAADEIPGNKPTDPFASVPPPPTLATSYSGWWTFTSMEHGGRQFTQKNSFRVVSQGDGQATGTYTYYSLFDDPCRTFIDAQAHMRWRDSSTLTIVATHRDKTCPKRTVTLRREASGRFSWASADGLQSMYFDPD